METAVWQVLTGQLARHAFSEGKQAVGKAGVVDSQLIPRDTSLSESAGLAFPAAQTGAFATLMSGLVVEGSAAVFLAAVLEYLTAEIAELSGNACKVLGKTAVEPRHIMLAIGGDEELDAM
ncbi:histone-fold-containing protein, partial [Baffinella frigidus]